MLEASLSTARHRPTQDHSAPPRDSASCDVVTVPARQGLEAVDILRRGATEAVGPVLHDGDCDTLGFLVPPGTADAWDVPGSACTHTPASPSPERGPGAGPVPPAPSRAAAGCSLPAGPSSSPTRRSCGRRSARRPA